MRFLGVFLSIFLFSLFFVDTTLAYQPVVIEQPHQHDILPIEDPERSRAIYGELLNHPHTYEIVSEEPFDLSVSFTVPDLPEQKNNVSVLIYRVPRPGFAEEVVRLRAGNSSWEVFKESAVAEYMREGLSYESALEEGTYRIEVSTPDNIGRYVLSVGSGEDIDASYFEKIRQLARVKLFMGKPPSAIVATPFIYIQLLILLILGTLLVIFYPGIRKRLLHRSE